MSDVIKFKLRKDELVMLALVYLYLMLCPFNKVSRYNELLSLLCDI